MRFSRRRSPERTGRLLRWLPILLAVAAPVAWSQVGGGGIGSPQSMRGGLPKWRLRPAFVVEPGEHVSPLLPPRR